MALSMSIVNNHTNFQNCKFCLLRLLWHKHMWYITWFRSNERCLITCSLWDVKYPHFRRWKFADVRLVTTLDLLGPYAVLTCFKFQRPWGILFWLHLWVKLTTESRPQRLFEPTQGFVSYLHNTYVLLPELSGVLGHFFICVHSGL